MTYFPTSISSSNSPANPAPPLRFTTPEALREPHAIEQHSPISKQLAALVFQSPTTPDTWALSSPDSDPASSGAVSGSRGTAMEGGGDGDKKSKGKGKGRASRQSTPSASSSQGDMADNEAEAGSSQPGEQEQPPPPPKKKRTRTLTTPHQAAVLHALLAQSRFPTTAMREEVGRSIGLSARKVQIWFQNQRQKARRPKGQNVPPLTRPPQYGPFPSIPSGSTIGEPGSRAGPSGEGTSARPTGGESHVHQGAPQDAPSSAGSDMYGFRDTRDSEGQPRAMGFPPQLSGPGIPGSPPTTPRSPRSMRSAPYTRNPLPPVAGSGALRPDFLPMHRHSHSFPAPYPPASARPYTADDVARSSRTLTRPNSPPVRDPVDFDVRLPPLRLSRPRSRTFGGSELSSEGAGPSRLPAGVRQPQQDLALPPLAGPSRPRGAPLSESPFAYEPPLRLPPPFTLQPRPLWDDASFSPFSRPSSQSGSPPALRRMPQEPLVLPPVAGAPTLSPPHPYTLPPPDRAPDIRPPFVSALRAPPPPGLPRSAPTYPRPRRDNDDDESHDHGGAP